MKKLTLLTLISTLSCSTLVQAGGMGEQNGTCSSPFISLEGGYSTNTIGNYDFTVTGLNFRLASIKTSQHYTGRLAAGMISMVDDQVGMTGELGWGYYGRTTLNPNITGLGDFSMKHTLTGVDALVGIAFVQQSYSLFFKAGALIQNMTTENILSIPSVLPVYDTLTTKTNQTAALPEIKLGGAYNFDSNWAITAAYMLAMGSSSKTNADYNINTGRSTFNANNLNPTINSLLLGIQYTV